MQLRPTLQQLYQRMIEIDTQMNESSDVVERKDLKEERDKIQREIQRRLCVE
jgi:hypothetical protein